MSLRPDEQSDEMDAVLRELLADEADASETMDPAQKERVRRRLESALGLPPPNGGPGGGATASETSSSTGTGAAGKLALAALAIAAAVTLRVLTGQSPPVDDARGGRAEIVAVEDHAEAAIEAATPNVGSEVATPTVAVGDLPNAVVGDSASRPRIPARYTPTAQRARGLAEERALIAAARGALVSRRFEEAARLLREHEAAFPDGQLVTEREALRVWWLEDTGQTEAASLRAKQFHDTYPNSVLRSAVERRGL